MLSDRIEAVSGSAGGVSSVRKASICVSRRAESQRRRRSSMAVLRMTPNMKVLRLDLPSKRALPSSTFT